MRPALEFLVVGASHRTSSLAVRDRLFLEPDAVPAFLQQVRGTGVEQALALCTCDRFEIYAVAREAEAEAAAGRLAALLAGRARLTQAEGCENIRPLTGEAGLAHLFRVASSLDSLVIGEPHVLGQIKNGHRIAQTCSMTGPELDRALGAAYAAAKRVRSETVIGRRPVSMAAAAVSLAQDVHGDLKGSTAVLIGAGELGSLIASALLDANLAHLFVTHPTTSRADAAAQGFECHVMEFADIETGVARADIVIGALGGRRHAVTAGAIKAGLKKRRHRPMFLIDAAIPGDIDPAVDELDGAFLFALDDLERVALRGQALREDAAADAERIVLAAVAEYYAGDAERAAVPVLGALHRHFEDMRRQALADAAGDADKATRLLIHRLLHRPSQRLRAIAAGVQSQGIGLPAIERTLGELFGVRVGGEEQGARMQGEPPPTETGRDQTEKEKE